MNMKKLVSMVLALVMVMAMMVPAMAATISNGTADHSYTAYQIFSGTQAESEGMLGDIDWGTGIAKDAFLGALQASSDFKVKVTDDEGNESEVNAFAACETAAEVAVVLSNNKNFAEDFANIAAKYVTSGTTIGANETVKDLAKGYYLLVDTTEFAEDATNTAYNAALLQLTDAITIQAKYDVPEVDKTVDDNDANIGDTVTFTLTATMPSRLDGYETYKVIFHDTLSKGLEYDAITSVAVNGKTLTDTDYTVATGVVTGEDGVATGETTLTITIADVLTHGATAGSTVVVTYTAIVDADAVIGTEGNPNKVYLEYSNNPNVDGEGETGKTPEDDVKVYTWEIPVFKYTGTNTPLAGAGFTLYTDATCTQAINLVSAGNNIYKVCKLASGCTHTHVTEITTDATGKFEIEGLEKGTYYLKETTTPAGYNTAAVVTVVIGENGALTQNGSATTEVGILNQTGATLPETGGMGTTMMYIGGGLLVAFAVIMLVTKRRMNAAE